MSADARCGCTIGGLHRHACASVGHVDPPRGKSPESIDAVAVAVLAEHEYMPCSEHTPTVNAWWAQCEGCDWKGPRRSNRHGRDDDHRAHVAQALATALAAREQDALAAAWDAAAVEAHDLGWMHDHALRDMRARNPYRSERADAVGGEA